MTRLRRKCFSTSLQTLCLPHPRFVAPLCHQVLWTSLLTYRSTPCPAKICMWMKACLQFKLQTHKIAVLLSRRPVLCTSVSKSGLISQSLSFCCRKGVLLAAVNVRPWMWMDILRKTKGITESSLIKSNQVWSSRLSSRWQQDNSCSIPLILIHLDACGRILMPQCNYSTLPGASVLSLLSAASAW